MTLKEARRILGLGPDEDPRPHLEEFGLARERIAEMVRSAPNETLADRYQEGLIEFDKAMAAVREYLEAIGLAPREPDAVSQEELVDEEDIAVAGEYDGRPSRFLLVGAWVFVVVAVLAATGFYVRFKQDERVLIERMARIAELEREGSTYLENRRWQEAARAFAEIEGLDPGSDLASVGRRSIEAGMLEEHTQFVGYWTGQAIAELEAGRLDEAQAAVDQVLQKIPGEKQAMAIVSKIDEARSSVNRENALAGIRKQIDEALWEEAVSSCREFLEIYPDDEDGLALLADANAALEKREADRLRAGELLRMAVARDQGSFDSQAFEWLREAAALDPGSGEIAARLERMASYSRTIHVPGDFATPAEALAAARDRDRIILGPQVWKGPIVINVAVDLQGAGVEKTVVECAPVDGCAVTIGPDAKGARISGIAFRHATFHADGTERFAAALVRGGVATFVDCRFADASGHGLAVIEKGQVVATRCRFSDNGWNGAAAFGVGSLMEIRDSASVENFEHGIESWDGAAVILVNNRCEGNSRNGIHVDNGLASATIEGNQLVANREFGMVIGSAGSGRVVSNNARSNLLGGLVVRAAAASVLVSGNRANNNQGPGLVIEAGLARDNYRQNTLTGNKGTQLLADAVLSHAAESEEAAVAEPEPAPLSRSPEP